MNKPIHVWPVVRYDSLAATCLQAAPNVLRSLEATPSLYGLRIHCFFGGGRAPIFSNAIDWIEVEAGKLRAHRRQDITDVEKDAIIDLLSPNPAQCIDGMFSKAFSPLDDPDLSNTGWASATLCRDGVLLAHQSVQRAGREAAWEREFRKEEENGTTVLAQKANDNEHIPMSGRAATFISPERPTGSSHERLEYLNRLKTIFALHLEQFGRFMPQGRKFCIYSDWTPPNYSADTRKTDR